MKNVVPSLSMANPDGEPSKLNSIVASSSLTLIILPFYEVKYKLPSLSSNGAYKLLFPSKTNSTSTVDSI